MLDFYVIVVPFPSGATNFAPNSPIRGYRKLPNADKFIKYINRRPRCEAIPVNEHRTTMICSTCHRPNEPPDNWKQRYRLCRHCTDRSDLTLLPPNMITTFIGKRKLKRIKRIEREQAQAPNGDAGLVPAAEEAPQRPYGPYRPLEQPPRSPELTSKIVTIVKNDRLVEANEERPNKVWNRDVNAGRNILVKGILLL